MAARKPKHIKEGAVKAALASPVTAEETRLHARVLAELEAEEKARKAREYLGRDAPKATGHGPT